MKKIRFVIEFCKEHSKAACLKPDSFGELNKTLPVRDLNDPSKYFPPALLFVEDDVIKAEMMLPEEEFSRTPSMYYTQSRSVYNAATNSHTYYGEAKGLFLTSTHLPYNMVIAEQLNQGFAQIIES